jgi:hypothetical protein
MMPKIAYKDPKFRKHRTWIIDKANEILAEYMAGGFDVTLRQLYYQFVSRGYIANSLRSYKNLGACIDEARLCGLIDWNAIVDRTRNLLGKNGSEGPDAVVESSAYGLHYSRWDNQPKRVEVWVEKEALIGVVAKICGQYDVDHFACKGYVSQSEMWRAAERLIEYERQGQTPIILHFGDHDPSGCDMTRDIVDRLAMFGATVKVERLALNMPQIRKHNPPPNPAKMSDSRCGGYVAKHGKSSWELDALPPDVLAALVRKAINKHRDIRKWKKVIAREQEDRSVLQALANHWSGTLSSLVRDRYEEEIAEILEDYRQSARYRAELK